MQYFKSGNIIGLTDSHFMIFNLLFTNLIRKPIAKIYIWSKIGEADFHVYRSKVIFWIGIIDIFTRVSVMLFQHKSMSVFELQHIWF